MSFSLVSLPPPRPRPPFPAPFLLGKEEKDEGGVLHFWTWSLFVPVCVHFLARNIVLLYVLFRHRFFSTMKISDWDKTQEEVGLGQNFGASSRTIFRPDPVGPMSLG